MKLALFGYGAMGQLVASLTKAGGDEIGAILTSKDAARNPKELSELLRGHDAAIDFSVGPAVLSHVEVCCRAGVPLVEGTTGWKDQEGQVRQLVQTHDGAFVFGANFSIGVNVFYRIVSEAAQSFSKLEQYEAFIEEQHHSRKRDAPSGTALKLKALMDEAGKAPVSLASTRAGEIPGTHRVGFDSVADEITLVHTARSREGFAAGALLAAKWIVGRNGVYEFTEVIEKVMSEGQ